MKKSVKWIIAAAAFAVLITAAVLLYNGLSENYQGDSLAVNASSQTQENAGSDDEQKAPDFTVLDSEGNKVKLSDYRGKPVVLNFWATWCYYCKQEMPDFDKAYEKYPGVHFMMVNATDGARETAAAAKEYIKEQNFDFPVFFDTESEAASAYYVTGLPSTFFINKDGEVVTYANGMLDLQTLEKGIEMITE